MKVRSRPWAEGPTRTGRAFSPVVGDDAPGPSHRQKRRWTEPAKTRLRTPRWRRTATRRRASGPGPASIVWRRNLSTRTVPSGVLAARVPVRRSDARDNPPLAVVCRVPGRMALLLGYAPNPTVLAFEVYL